MKVYEGTGVAGCDDDSFLDSDETISYTVGECVEDEHGHDEHDEDEISGARGRERASLASLLIAVGALLTAHSPPPAHERRRARCVCARHCGASDNSGFSVQTGSRRSEMGSNGMSHCELGGTSQ